MGKPALADRPHSDIDCDCWSLRDPAQRLRRDFRRVGGIGKSPHHQTAEIRNWPCNLRWCASDGFRRKKLDVSRGYLHWAGGSGSDSTDMATLRAVLRNTVQLFQE